MREDTGMYQLEAEGVVTQAKRIIANETNCGATNVTIEVWKDRMKITSNRPGVSLQQHQSTLPFDKGDANRWGTADAISRHIMAPGTHATVYNKSRSEDADPIKLHTLGENRLIDGTAVTQEGTYDVYLTEAGPLPPISIIRQDGVSLQQPQHSYPNHVAAFYGPSDDPGTEVTRRMYALVAHTKRDAEPIHRRTLEDLADQMMILFTRYLEKWRRNEIDANRTSILFETPHTLSNIQDLAEWDNAANPDVAEISKYLRNRPTPPPTIRTTGVNGNKQVISIDGADTCTMLGLPENDAILRHLINDRNLAPIKVANSHVGPMKTLEIERIDVTDGKVVRIYHPHDIAEDPDMIVQKVGHINLHLIVKPRSSGQTEAPVDNSQIHRYVVPSPMWIQNNGKGGKVYIHTSQLANDPKIVRDLVGYTSRTPKESAPDSEYAIDLNGTDIFEQYVTELLTGSETDATRNVLRKLADIAETIGVKQVKDEHPWTERSSTGRFYVSMRTN